jgi:hypothetical protein
MHAAVSITLIPLPYGVYKLSEVWRGPEWDRSQYESPALTS